MGRAVGPEQVGVGQGTRIAPIGLDPPRAGGVHGGEVGVGDNDLVTEALETTGNPFTVGRGLDQNPRPRSLAEDRREALALGADALLDQFASVGHDTDFTFSLVTSMPSLRARAVSSPQIEGLRLGGGLSPW